MQRLVLLASPTLRRGPLSALQRFVRDYEEFFKGFEIITTEGCRRALLRSGLLQGHPYFFAELPGYLGGIVHLSALVVDERNRPEAVIYLIDPRDPSSIFPETNAIKRECVVHEVTFLSTSRAAREWATIRWNAPRPQFVAPGDTGSLRLVRSVNEETIALIAHDGRKRELLEFARDHFSFLLRFRRRVATGTTGHLLNGFEPDQKRLSPSECAELAPVCRDLASLIAEAKKGGRLEANTQFVDPQLSGPRGGDVMIARMVLADNCQRIVFFENPLEPHEHTEDIQLLERSGRLRGKSTICIHDRRTAEWFVKRWQELATSANTQPMLLSVVIERLFGVKCMLVESKENWRDTWADLRQAAGWFVLSHIAMLANERKRLSENVRVSISWGVGSSQVVAELAARLDRLNVVEKKIVSQPGLDQEILEDGGSETIRSIDRRFHPESLADERYFRPGNLIVAPIQGLVGSEDEDVEANEIARRFAEFFGGKHLPLPANVLVRRGGDAERRRERFQDVYAHWSNTDIVIATTGPLVEQYEDRPRTPHFVGYTSEMGKLGACGDLGGLFLDPRGQAVTGDYFERIGMTAEQLRRVQSRRGVIVVSGAQMQRATITLAALMGGWISVLVTDTTFARHLVREVARLVSDGDLVLNAPDNGSPLIRSR